MMRTDFAWLSSALRRSRLSGSVLCLALLFLVSSVALAKSSQQKKATDEALSFVPKDFAACLVLEDIDGNLERFRKSAFGEQSQTRSLLSRFANTNDFKRLIDLEGAVSGYIGVSIEELRRDVVGESVVLAFRAGRTDKENDAGLLVCRIRKPQVADKVMAAITKSGNNRKVEAKRHREIEYRKRIEGAQTDYVLRIGNVIAFTDNESAIQSVIDARSDRISFADSTHVKRLRSTLPNHSLVQLLVQPRAFDQRWKWKSAFKPSEAIFATLMDQLWRAISGLACTMNLEDGVAIGLHVSSDQPDVPETTAAGAQPAPRSDFWEKVPPDAVAAASVAVDFALAGSIIGRAAAMEKENIARQTLDFMNQLLGGKDVGKDVLPNIGPEVGVIATTSDSALKPNVVALTRLNDTKPKRAGDLPLSSTLESALRPMLVLLAMENNRETKGAAKAKTANLEGVRYHFLSGLKDAPAWVQPGFAVTAEYVLTATSQNAAEAFLKRSAVNFWTSPAGKAVTARMPQGGSLVFFANMSKLREMLEREKTGVVKQFGGAQNEDQGKIKDRIDTLLDITELFDYCIITVHKTSSIQNITLSLLPTAKQKQAPQPK